MTLNIPDSHYFPEIHEVVNSKISIEYVSQIDIVCHLDDKLESEETDEHFNQNDTSYSITINCLTTHARVLVINLIDNKL